MKRTRAKNSKPQAAKNGRSIRRKSVAGSPVSSSASKSKVYIASVASQVGRARWTVTRKESWIGKDDSADVWDIKQIQTDLGVLARQCDLLRDAAVEQMKCITSLKLRLTEVEKVLKRFDNLGAKLDELGRALGPEVMVQAFKALCEQQLTAIDKRMAEMSALEARVLELTKNLKA